MKAALRQLAWPLWLGILLWPLAGPVWSAGAAGATLAFSLAFRFLIKPAAGGISCPAIVLLSPKWQKAVWLALACLLLLLPLALNRYFLDVVITAGIYIALALGLNIIVGLAGLLVLGYIAFYAAGAYCYALLSIHLHLNFFLALPLGAGLAMLFGLLLGLPTLRLRGDYLAIVTLGFGEIVRIVLNNWDSVTGGPNGIMHIAKPALAGLSLGRPGHLYYLVLGICLLTAFFIHRLNGSRLGRALVAMREDEAAARACGVDTVQLKLLAFMLSAAVAGIMGAVFAAKMGFVSPESFTFWESIMVLCMVVLGGMASIPGVVLGAAALIVLPEAFRQLQSYRMLIFGASMVAMMIFRPQGLLPSKRRKMEMEEKG
jgi:branched-chain amino acid transport system permease protein